MKALAGLKDQLIDFTRETSLDGWNFITKPGLSKIRRLFWVLAVVASACGAVYFNLTFLNEFFAATTLVTVKSSSASLNNVIFPSIVVCNHNQVGNIMICAYLCTTFHRSENHRLLNYA